MYVYTYIYTCIYTYIYILHLVQSILPQDATCIYIYIYTHIYIYICIYIYTHIYMYIYINIHTTLGKIYRTPSCHLPLPSIHRGAPIRVPSTPFEKSYMTAERVVWGFVSLVSEQWKLYIQANESAFSLCSSSSANVAYICMYVCVYIYIYIYAIYTYICIRVHPGKRVYIFTLQQLQRQCFLYMYI